MTMTQEKMNVTLAKAAGSARVPFVILSANLGPGRRIRISV